MCISLGTKLGTLVRWFSHKNRKDEMHDVCGQEDAVEKGT